MSIIQEALRKAQEKTVGGDTAVSTRHSTAKKEEIVTAVEREPAVKKKPIKANLYLLIFFAVFLLLSGKYFATIPPKTAQPENAALKNSRPAEAPQLVAEPYTPAVPQQYAIPEHPVIPQDDFQLSGIMHLQDGPRALINNLNVAEGDKVEGATVITINDDNVVLKKRNSEIILHLK